MRPTRAALLLLSGVLALGCVRRIPEVTPEDIPRLEEALRTSPGDPLLLTELGIARYRARDYEAARETLNRAVETGEAEGAAYLFLGLANEAEEDWGAARQAYTQYLARGRYDPLKEDIEKRLALIVRQELRARARDALAREEELSRAAPTPRTVAVFPFRLVSENEELLPLQVAMADMMTTDLALSGALRVLERTQVQTLLREMALTEAGFTEPSSGARAGRLLRSEHVIQGALTTLPGEALRFDTDVLNTVRQTSEGEATAQDRIDRIFDIEKETVFRVLDILGVEITPAEREAINQNRAENLLSFLAYGRGLMALDQGNYEEAQQFFQEAVRLDPGFQAAQDGLANAEALQEATGTSTDDIAARSTGELAPPTIGTTAEDPGVVTSTGVSTTSSILQTTTEGVVPSPTGIITNLGSPTAGTDDQTQKREPTQESKGQEGVTRPTTAQIRITIRRPGGKGG